MTLVLLTGGAMCLTAGGYLLLLLRLWPRVFLRRFPDEVRAAVAPLSATERLLGTIATLPLLAMLLGFPAWIALRLQEQAGANVGFGTLFAASYTVWMLFNLFDWLILDELVVGVLRPRWLVLKGAEHVPFRFDRAAHARSFLNGAMGGAVVCGVIVALVVLLN